MAIIPQRRLFSWQQVEAGSDLDRLKIVLEVLPDEGLMVKLEALRGKGRDDYPVRAVWNSLLAGIVYQHPSIESLRRELKRNGELREICGFDPAQGGSAVPTESAYTRFMGNLFRFELDIEGMFDDLLNQLGKELSDLGQHMAVDSKAIESAGKATNKEADGRRDVDADTGVKVYRGERKDGTLWEKVKTWFGYKLHLLVDVTYEIPLSYEVTKASWDDTSRLLPLVESLKRKQAWAVERGEDLSADKGYDSEKNNRALYDEYGIKPIIDIRHDWQDGEMTRPLHPDRVDNIVSDEHGSIFCVAQCVKEPGAIETIPMAFYGFEKDRKTLKYRCPSAAYGFECGEWESCCGSGYGRIVRVPLKLDRRHFVPVPRDSYKWRRLYKKRTGVERVNSRLDVSFGFERHFIRGLKKMRVRVGLALIVMLAMALGSIRRGHRQRMRSLVWSPKRLAAA